MGKGGKPYSPRIPHSSLDVAILLISLSLNRLDGYMVQSLKIS